MSRGRGGIRLQKYRIESNPRALRVHAVPPGPGKSVITPPTSCLLVQGSLLDSLPPLTASEEQRVMPKKKNLLSSLANQARGA
eukprot:656070-Hanusia_phi.AAC.1